MVILILSWHSPKKKSINELKELYFSEIKRFFSKFDYINYEPLGESLDINNIHEDRLEEITEDQQELSSISHNPLNKKDL